MSFDMFIKFEGIVGESTDAKHKGEIDVLSYNFGLANSVIDRGTGAGSGSVTFHDFHFVSRKQKSSPPLFLRCARREHIKSAVLTARSAGDKAGEFYKLTFADILITQINETGDANGDEQVPLEQTSFNFAKIDISYAPQKADDSLEKAVTASWEIVRK